MTGAQIDHHILHNLKSVLFFSYNTHSVRVLKVTYYWSVVDILILFAYFFRLSLEVILHLKSFLLFVIDFFFCLNITGAQSDTKEILIIFCALKQMAGKGSKILFFYIGVNIYFLQCFLLLRTLSGNLLLFIFYICIIFCNSVFGILFKIFLALNNTHNCSHNTEST